MSDDEDNTGFGAEIEEEDDEDTGFGAEDVDEDEDEGGFGDGFDDDEDEEIDDAGFGTEEIDEEVEKKEAAPKLPPVKKSDPGAPFKAFATKYFKNASPTYDINPIKAPLLKLTPKSGKIAVNVYKLICQFMGITAVVGKSSLSALQGVQRIIEVPLKNDELKDEIYCHIMKQWTDNPSPQSRARGTILLALCLGSFTPSKKLLPVLQQFILDGPKGFRPFCNLLLRRTLHNGVRINPPCQLEIQAVKKKQIMRINVTTDLCTNKTATARLDPASTSAEWVDEIAQQLGIKDKYGWMIFMNRFGTLVSLRGDGKGQHIMDAISRCDSEAVKRGMSVKESLSVTGQFSFRKEFFAPDHNSLKDPIATHLIYHQIQYGIKNNDFKCPKMEDYNILAAQMYYALYGDDLDSKRLEQCLTAWLPDQVLSAQKLKDRLPIIEKLHAKSEYSRKQFTPPQTENLVIKYALDKWGKVNSFSSDGAMMLMKSK